MTRLFLFLCFVALLCCGCGKGEKSVLSEDERAKELLQGIWVADDNKEPVMLVKKDSISFPDSASVTVYFRIDKDSIYLHGQTINAYKILKQTANSFTFRNENGEDVVLSKSNDSNLRASFDYHVYAMNTFTIERSDTLVKTDRGYYQCDIYAQTGSERVIKSTFNDVGLEIDNVYLDNVISVNIQNGGKLVFSHDFRKAAFQSLVDKEFLKKSILKALRFSHTDMKALYFEALIGIPDAASSYMIELRITPDGKITKRTK